MGKSIPVTVGGQFFPTKTALKAHVRGLIDCYSVGSFLDDADLRFCLSLFRFHSEAQAKFGSGVSRSSTPSPSASSSGTTAVSMCTHSRPSLGVSSSNIDATSTG